MSGWQVLWDGIRTISPFVVVGGGFITWWLRDRRKDHAAAQVAEQTVPADVKLKDVGADQAELVYLAQAFDAERASLVRQRDDRDMEIARQRAELAHRDELIATLRIEAEDLRGKLAEATRQLASVMARLDELSAKEPSEELK